MRVWSAATRQRSWIKLIRRLCTAEQLLNQGQTVADGRRALEVCQSDGPPLVVAAMGIHAQTEDRADDLGECG